MNETTLIEQPKTDELAKILTDSKLELTEAETIKQSYLPYFEQMAVIKSEASKINWDAPTELDETIARNLRLRTVKIRTGSMAVKEERKRIHMLKANVEQSAWNLIKSTCELDEERFLQVEKKREIELKAKNEARQKERLEKLIPFEVDTQFIDLLNMDDASFGKLLFTSELAYNNKIAEAKRIEEEEKQRLIVAEEKRQEMIAENNRLRKEAEEKELALAKEREEAEARLKEIKDKAEAERKEAENKARIEREAAEKEAKRIKAEQDAILEKERQERLKIEKELADKKLADEKLQKEAEERAEAELSKGDKEKFADFIKDIESLITKYTFKSKKYKVVHASGVELLNKTVNFLISKQ